jgi:hypothetical protein
VVIPRPLKCSLSSARSRVDISGYNNVATVDALPPDREGELDLFDDEDEYTELYIASEDVCCQDTG